MSTARQSAAVGVGAACMLLLAMASQSTPRARTVLDATGLINDQLAGRAVSWGSLDCYNRGSSFESAALGCSNAGGCDVWGRAHARPSYVPECAATSEVCVEHFKTCLVSKHPYTRRPVPPQAEILRSQGPILISIYD
jgi:hypothetical protein